MSGMEVRNFDKPDETRPFQAKGAAQIVMLGGSPVSLGSYEPGWRWSEHVKPIVGTESCQVAHLGYCVQGRMRIYMDDGTERDVVAGDIVAIPPGHDGAVVGEETCVFLDFGEVAGYAKPR